MTDMIELPRSIPSAEQRDECWLDSEAVFFFQMFRHLRSRNISDFRNSTFEEFHRFHRHPPGDSLSLARIGRQAGRPSMEQSGLFAADRLVDGSGSECACVRQGLAIAESQVRDYQASLGLPFAHLSELTSLRDLA